MVWKLTPLSARILQSIEPRNNVVGFTDRKPRVATIDDVIAPWSHCKNGQQFRCLICDKFIFVGDMWQWVYGNAPDLHWPCGNFLAHTKCCKENAIAEAKRLGRKGYKLWRKHHPEWVEWRRLENVKVALLKSEI